MSVNEIGWPKLMHILYILKNNGTDIHLEELSKMHYNLKAVLVNEYPVTCAIHFNKLINVIMNIWQSKRLSPFGINYVTHYFKRIEFQHRGSPHAPADVLGPNKAHAEALIDRLISVSDMKASGNLNLSNISTHSHATKKTRNSSTRTCRFGAPFMPIPSTTILIPMPVTDSRRI